MRQGIEAMWRERAYRVWAVIGFLVLLAIAGWALNRVSSALIPFVMAFVLAFVLSYPVRMLEERGLKRPTAAAIAMLALILIVGLAITFFIPPLVRQLADLAKNAPVYLKDVEEYVNNLQAQFQAGGLMPPWLRTLVVSAAGNAASLASTWGEKVGTWLVGASGSALTLLVDALIAVVLAFWFLRDTPTIRREIYALAGREREEHMDMLFSQVNRSMSGYLRGQTLASLSTGVLSAVGLAIAGVPYSYLLGALAFILNYIPYVGPLLTGLVAAIVALFSVPGELAWGKALIAIGIVVLVQQITDNLIMPRVMATEVALHPTLIIFALLVGGTLFGIPGMLFAIPVAAAAQGAFVYYFERATASELATENGALFVRADDEDEQSVEA